MKPLPHQQAFLDTNPNKAILAWEMRVGKTLPGALWIDDASRRGNTYIITPKGNLKDWQRMGTKATVVTKEQFKKLAIKDPTAIVVDEAHYFAAGLFKKKRSQLATHLYNLVKRYPQCHILLLTATPIRQDPWSLHTLLCYIGVYYDWKEWRSEFFALEEAKFIKLDPRKPWLTNKAWFPNKDWRTMIRYYLEKHCSIVSLKDIVKDLPPPTVEVIKVKQPKYVRPKDKVVTWIDEHRHEQQNKVKEILNLGYKKLIVVCHYTEQIDELQKELSKEKPVYVLDGRTKDADEVKMAAQNADECYFIVQSSMGFGFDGYMFGAIVFASMSHSCLNHTQMTGRLRNINQLNPVVYYYIIGGRWDKAIYDCIIDGNDFNPHLYRFAEPDGAAQEQGS